MLLVTALGLLALERFGDWRAPVGAPVGRSLTGVARDYDDSLHRLTVHAEGAANRAATMPDDWLMHEIEARAWLFRARLTGSYEDWARAAAALSRGMAVARPGTGPHTAGALLNFAMHRLGPASAFLDQIDDYAVPPDRDDRAEQRAMRGDVALYRGDYAVAWKLYDEADRIAPGTADFRRAIYLGKTGRPEGAERLLDRSERAQPNPTRQVRSFYELQRAILDLERGRLDETMAHLRRANTIFPGHWLIEEHIAEVLTLQGRTDQAEALYRDIIHRTGHPEYIDALAGIAEARGEALEARRLYAQSGAIWARRLKLFPEAAYGHAIDHCAAKGDWACALRLATRNHAARPYGDAKVALARALLGSGRAEEARRTIEPVLASAWRTADLHRTAADIYQAKGMAAEAAEQDRLARAIDPLV